MVAWIKVFALKMVELKIQENSEIGLRNCMGFIYEIGGLLGSRFRGMQ